MYASRILLLSCLYSMTGQGDDDSADVQGVTNATTTAPDKKESPSDIKDFFVEPFSYTTLHDGYLASLALKFPKTLKKIEIGKSSNEKAIYAYEIIHCNNIGAVVVIDAGMNGNERITVNFAAFIIHQLVEHDSAYVSMHCGVKYAIIPLLNPDGYEYAQTKDADYNLNVHKEGNCGGINLERNFDAGTHKITSQCATFPGLSFFSEPESIALRDYMLSLKRVKMYVNLHSGRQIIAHPYAYKPSTPEIARSNEMAANMRNVLNYYDKHFNGLKNFGSLGKMKGDQYPGAPIDWAMEKVRVSYSLYLSLRDAEHEDLKLVLFSTFEALQFAILQLQVNDPDVAEAIYDECESADANHNYVQKTLFYIVCAVACFFANK